MREILKRIIDGGGCLSHQGNVECDECPLQPYQYGGCGRHDEAVNMAKQKLKEMDMIPELKGVEMLVWNDGFPNTNHKETVYGLDQERGKYIGLGNNWDNAKPIETVKMTVAQVARKLGHSVEIVEG